MQHHIGAQDHIVSAVVEEKARYNGLCQVGIVLATCISISLEV